MARLRPIDFRRLRSLVRPVQVLERMGWRATWVRSTSLMRGPCPIHGSGPGSRSLVVSPSVVYCHKCHWTGDALALWCKWKGLKVLDGAYDLCQTLGVSPPLPD